MRDITNALLRALRTLFHPRILTLNLWPALIALLVWGIAAYFFWTDWVNSASSLVARSAVDDWLARWELHTVATLIVVLLVLALLAPSILITALLIAALFAMPIMVRHIASRDFPNLEMRKGGTFAGSVWNAVVAIVVFATLWLLTLPLWLFAPLAIVIPLALSAFLNQRLFRYDALSEHASKHEFDQILKNNGSRLYLLGALAGLLHYVPLLNFFSPIFTGLAFIYFGLDELQKLRSPARTDKPPASLADLA